MRIELNVPESGREPRFWIKHQPVLAMALQPGSIEIGLRRSEMKRFTVDAGEMSLVPNHLEKWFRNEDLHGLSVAISNAAVTTAADGTSGEVELRKVDKLVDAGQNDADSRRLTCETSARNELCSTPPIAPSRKGSTRLPSSRLRTL